MPHTTSLTTDDHPARLRIETTTREDVAMIEVHGEGDRSTLADLEAALVRVPLEAVTQVQLDVTGLDFADTSTIRRLAVFAEQAKEAGKDMTTLGASPMLRTVSEVLELEDELNLA